MTLTSASEALRAALVAAFAPHVRARIADLGLDVSDSIEASITEGAGWLADELGALLSQPFEAQRRGPLQVFQAAMSFPTARLLEQGCEPVTRDPVVVNAMPGDVFDLAPASPAELGEDVWSAHLEWGALKASSLGGGLA